MTSVVPKHVLMVAHTYFPEDPRVRRECDALAAAGHRVDVLALRGPGESRKESLPSGVEVMRLPVARHRGGGAATYALEYLSFLLMAFFKVSVLHAARRYDVVQVHTLPDALVFSALLPRLMGADIILDMHDLMPELFVARYGLSEAHAAVRFLRALERASCGFARRVIVVHDPMRDVLESRGLSSGKVTVVANASASGPALRAARDARAGRTGRKGLLVMYHGLLSDVYDVRTAIDAVRILRASGIRDVVLEIVGDGPELPELADLVSPEGLGEQVRLRGKVAHDSVPDVLAEADVGIVPIAPGPYADLALPTKLLEGLAAGMPVIVARTRTVAHYLDEDSVCFYEPGDARELADAMLALRDDPALRRRLADGAADALEPLSWERMRRRYLGLVQ